MRGQAGACGHLAPGRPRQSRGKHLPTATRSAGSGPRSPQTTPGDAGSWRYRFLVLPLSLLPNLPLLHLFSTRSSCFRRLRCGSLLPGREPARGARVALVHTGACRTCTPCKRGPGCRPAVSPRSVPCCHVAASPRTSPCGARSSPELPASLRAPRRSLLAPPGVAGAGHCPVPVCVVPAAGGRPMRCLHGGQQGTVCAA